MAIDALAHAAALKDGPVLWPIIMLAILPVKPENINTCTSFLVGSIADKCFNKSAYLYPYV